MWTARRKAPDYPRLAPTPRPTPQPTCSILRAEAGESALRGTLAGGSGDGIRSRIQPLELRVTVQELEVWIASGPTRGLEAGFPGSLQRVHRIVLLSEVAEEAGGVVEDRGLVGAQRHRQGHLALGVFRPADFRVIVGQEHSRASVFRHLLQVCLEELGSPLNEGLACFDFSQGAERVGDRDVDVVVLPR